MASLSKLQTFLHGEETLHSYERRLNDSKTTELSRRVQRLQNKLKAYYLSLFGLITRVSSYTSALFREDLIVTRVPTLNPLQYTFFSISSKLDDRYFLSFLPSSLFFSRDPSQTNSFSNSSTWSISIGRAIVSANLPNHFFFPSNSLFSSRPFSDHFSFFSFAKAKTEPTPSCRQYFQIGKPLECYSSVLSVLSLLI
jgi:hypothetical protein